MQVHKKYFPLFHPFIFTCKHSAVCQIVYQTKILLLSNAPELKTSNSNTHAEEEAGMVEWVLGREIVGRKGMRRRRGKRRN